MQELPADWNSLAMLVFMLGMKHGFDADHLATIDGLTRLHARRDARLARLCGTLFSLGHGSVVVVVALCIGVLARQWQVPAWLDAAGAGISVVFLLGLGLANLHAVFACPPDQLVRPRGLRARLFIRLAQGAHPLGVLLVGGLFALSFDTVSQAALFALAGVQLGGVLPVLLLALLFLLGMLVTDGVNGWWMSHLLTRADQIARIASRVMGLVVASLALLVAALGAARHLLPVFERWSEGKEFWFGLAVLLSMLLAFFWALRLARTSTAA